jgi:hypothetical protein
VEARAPQTPSLTPVADTATVASARAGRSAPGDVVAWWRPLGIGLVVLVAGAVVASLLTRRRRDRP